MKKEFRIKKSKEIDAIIHRKQRIGNDFFVVYYKENNLTHFRFAISIGRKYGNAVNRNKIKRQIRSIVRNQSSLPNYDYVIVVKKKADTLTYQTMVETITKQLNKSKGENR